MPGNHEFESFCAAAETFWRTNTLPPSDQVIVVEAMTQDVRVTIRNLTFANALRTFIPARLLVITGADEEWLGTIWTSYDIARLEELSRAYGASEVVNVHELVDRLVENQCDGFTLTDRKFSPSDLRTGIDAHDLETVVHASAARVFKVPRVSAEERHTDRYLRIRSRAEKFSQLYDTAFSSLNTVAVITSHLDYTHWGLAVDSAIRGGIPVINVAPVGMLKAYALFPEARQGGFTFRAELTKQIGEFFERFVWPHRGRLHRAAELTTWRNKCNLGRPTWWRRVDSSALELRSPVERAAVRRHAARRFGLDPAKPVVGIFNHAISDALHTNIELFGDLGAWFEQTVHFAERWDEVNWLFIDHPSQFLYDETNFFASIADQNAAHGHMAFVHNRDLGKNLMWSLVDLGITVRGSISNELPAYGVPVIQAGWSEWSELGFSAVAHDADDYWRIMRESLDALKAGRPLLNEEQIERARLWMWFYRSAADVPSPFVQPWDMGTGDDLFRALRIAMRQIESDGDSAFEAVRRMWERREPCLTRFDLTAKLPSESVASHQNAPSVTTRSLDVTEPRLTTLFDTPVRPVVLPGQLSRGQDETLQVVDGFVRGVEVLGRFSRSPGLFGLKLPDRLDTEGRLRVTATLSVDARAGTWWERRAPSTGTAPTAGPRLLLVRAQDERGMVLLPFNTKGGQARVSFDLAPYQLEPGGLLVLEVDGLRLRLPTWATETLAPQPAVGVVVRSVEFAKARAEEPTRVCSDAARRLYNGLYLAYPDTGDSGPICHLQPRIRPGRVSDPAPNTGGRWGGRVNHVVSTLRRKGGEKAKAADLPTAPDLLRILDQLWRDGGLRVRAVGLRTAVELSTSVSLVGDRVEVRGDSPLSEPALIRLDIESHDPAAARLARAAWCAIP